MANDKADPIQCFDCMGEGIRPGQNFWCVGCRGTGDINWKKTDSPVLRDESDRIASISYWNRDRAKP